jgi:hypothetical protein
VAFTVDAEIPTGAMSCNCSHCQRKGFLLTYVPAGQFKLDNGEDQLATYTFNKHAIRHRFCRTCGVQAFGEGEREGMALRAVNLRCVPEVDINALEIQKVDGARF